MTHSEYHSVYTVSERERKMEQERVKVRQTEKSKR